MGSRITQRLVDGAKAPKNGQILVRDSEIRGFALRITPNGCKTWVWDGRINRRMRRITIARWPDLTLNEARAEALRIRHDIAIGLDPSPKRDEEIWEMNLGKLAQRYLEEHSKLHKRSWLDDDRRIRIHLRPLAELKISEISREGLTRWHQGIGDERGRFQANRCLALVSAILGWANRLGYCHGESPAKGIRKFREHKRERFLK